ncbi:MAG: 50S ribosomal protein L31 [Rickettsiales bacterium]|nr:50S ribosomal protein L31 [Rickettsiales bacterium]
MKQDIHPKTHKITVELPGGEQFETISTFRGDRLVVDVDYRKHPAWTKKGVAQVSTTNAKVSKFNKKFGNLSFATSNS